MGVLRWEVVCWTGVRDVKLAGGGEGWGSRGWGSKGWGSKGEGGGEKVGVNVSV